jgi:hypothetical protein
MPKKRKTILDFCFITSGYDSKKAQNWLRENNLVQENCGLSKISNAKDLYALFYDENSMYKGIMNKETTNEVSVSSIPSGKAELAYLFFNQDHYSSYCKEHTEYWEWVEKRNKDRYDLNLAHGKNYDSKNMMHTIRLLQVALEIVRDGKLTLKRANRAELLAIKNGEYEYDEIVRMAEKLIDQLEDAEKTSYLQEKPDSNGLERILVEIREELYNDL